MTTWHHPLGWIIIYDILLIPNVSGLRPSTLGGLPPKAKLSPINAPLDITLLVKLLYKMCCIGHRDMTLLSRSYWFSISIYFYQDQDGYIDCAEPFFYPSGTTPLLEGLGQHLRCSHSTKTIRHHLLGSTLILITCYWPSGIPPFKKGSANIYDVAIRQYPLGWILIYDLGGNPLSRRARQ